MTESLMPSRLFRLQQVSLCLPIGAQYLLQDISCEIFSGDRIALVGASGAGKTSLLRVLNRLSEVSQGKLFFADQDIRQIPVLNLRQRVVLVPQESKLLGMTVQEALSYPLKLRGIEQSTIQQRLHTWMEQLHLPQDWLERTEAQLSVGQRQWVAIVRALVIQPQVLLLDEPTASLDAGRGEHLVEILRGLAESQQTTIVMANHQLDLAQKFCDRILYLHQGRLERDQPADQVDWLELKDDLLQSEARAAEEWA